MISLQTHELMKEAIAYAVWATDERRCHYGHWMDYVRLLEERRKAKLAREDIATSLANTNNQIHE